MSLHVRIDCSPIYELIGSYMLYVHRKWIRNVEGGPNWIQQVEAQLSTDAIEQSTLLRKYSMHEFDILFAAALEREHPHDIPLFLTQLGCMTEDDWSRIIQLYGLPYDQACIDRIRQVYIPALILWYDHYLRWSVPLWEPALIADANEKRRLMSKMNPTDLIEIATNGVVLDTDGEIQEVVLAPMWHYRPINNTCTFKHSTLMLYSIDLPEDTADTPPQSLKRMISALADDTRLRILRMIAVNPVTFAELSEHLNLGKNAVQHHLAVLRSAGYIRTYWSGKVEQIALRQEGLADLSVFLEDYVQP
ncbi:winged helix-turn-helix domain-containing protein [Paenibacillus sp. ACRRX]|uniref:ArsR/SmtB family transcription factor n=1 Tax=Paenibacillus sp. ACRRX TaxID=2918206 RepID=UPI001EF595CB|nr:winged helix-turn-helix domain-containing protein [Paenibacillus sp. ACRRX]MCG7407132.1 winged helix-turn-helix domain-containing protein [Paenibacillus sp. ACRRX]